MRRSGAFESHISATMNLVLVVFVATALFSSATHATEVNALPQDSFAESTAPLFGTPDLTTTEVGPSLEMRC